MRVLDGLRLRAILVVVASALGFGAVAQEKGEVRKPDDLVAQLEIEERFSLGRRISLVFALEAKSTQEITTIDTADVRFALTRVSSDGKELAKWEVSGGGARAVLVPGAGDVVKFGRVQPKTQTIRKGDRIGEHFDLSKTFGRDFDRGRYRLSVSYEGFLTVEARFRIVVYYKESVPALIDLIENGDFERKVWARNTLFIIAGQPAWSPSATDGLDKVKSEVQKLRAWWSEHKALIELINRQLVPIEEEEDK